MTLFDKILAGEIPCETLYEDEHILAFKDINPQAPVHVLVIPKHKMARFDDLADQEPAVIGQLFQGAAKVARQLGLQEKGYRVVVNNGQDAQQTVEYIHLHLLAGRPLKWPPG